MTNTELVESYIEKWKLEPPHDATFDDLMDNGVKLDSTNEGTCLLYRYNGEYYVVLPDNSVITADEDREMEKPTFTEWY